MTFLNTSRLSCDPAERVRPVAPGAHRVDVPDGAVVARARPAAALQGGQAMGGSVLA